MQAGRGGGRTYPASRWRSLFAKGEEHHRYASPGRTSTQPIRSGRGVNVPCRKRSDSGGSSIIAMYASMVLLLPPLYP